MGTLTYMVHTEGPTYLVELGNPSWVTAITDGAAEQAGPEAIRLAALGECAVGEPLVLEVEDPQLPGSRFEHVAGTVLAITEVRGEHCLDD